MIIKLKKNLVLYFLALLFFAAGIFFLVWFLKIEERKMVMGGALRVQVAYMQDVKAVIAGEEEKNERYHRPSKSAPFPNPYSYRGSGMSRTFTSPEEVVDAYYGVLREASNLEGYAGGCGTVGEGSLPYPVAYSYLSKGYQSRVKYDAFLRSFEGVGHTTYLKRYPAYAVPGTPDTRRYYMVEIETIDGEKEHGTRTDPVHFSYYYGIVTTEKEGEGWKIADIEYYPEDFLCAPYHSWFYDAASVVGIVYQENLKLIERVDSVKREGDITRIEGSGMGGKYRFEFIRLSNGYDILLHEYKWNGKQWVETSLLSEDWKYLKLIPGQKSPEAT